MRVTFVALCLGFGAQAINLRSLEEEHTPATLSQGECEIDADTKGEGDADSKGETDADAKGEGEAKFFGMPCGGMGMGYPMMGMQPGMGGTMSPCQHAALEKACALIKKEAVDDIFRSKTEAQGKPA